MRLSLIKDRLIIPFNYATMPRNLFLPLHPLESANSFLHNLNVVAFATRRAGEGVFAVKKRNKT